jgi:succinoglycan biosynthesis protein ExoV
VIRRIAAAPLVIAESMHAAIIADAFRVPWIPVRFSPHFHAEKWLDWAASLDMTLAIPPLVPLLYRLRALRKPRRAPVPQPAAFHGDGVEGAASRPPAPPRPGGTLRQMVIVQGLRRTARRRPCLSDPDILARKQQACREILREVIHDYATLPV